MALRERDAAIVGIHEYPSRRIPGMTPLQIKAASAERALADAGLQWADVDALYDAGEAGETTGMALAEYFGLHPNILDTTSVGGSSYEFHANHAKRAIAAGRARVALLTYGSTARSEARAVGTGGRARTGPPSPLRNMEAPWGTTLIASYALVAQRHIHQYGTTPEQLAEIAVVTRAHAMRNPQAVQALHDLHFRDVREISVEDVVSSRPIAEPLHLLDCCMISDGGGAVIIAAPEVAASCRHKPVWILGAAEAIGYGENGRDITVSAGAHSAPPAFAEAGVRPAEMDIAMLYDSFTITVMTLLEDVGLCAKGEGGAFVQGGRLRFDSGRKPALNTDGGGLSSNHPGMRGIFLLIEATRQLRGDSTAQVPGAALAVAHGNGGQLGGRHAGGTVILGRD